MSITFTTTLATPAVDYSVTVAEAVEIVNRALVSRDNSEARVKDAIEHAVNHALRETHCNARVYSFSTQAGRVVYPLDTELEARGIRVLGVWCGDEALCAMDWRELKRRQAAEAMGGRPTRYASLVPGEVVLFAKPDGAYEVGVKAWESCVSLAAGGTVINVPREFLLPMLRNGAAGLLAANGPEGRGGVGWTQFLRDDLPSIRRACFAAQIFVKPFVREA